VRKEAFKDKVYNFSVAELESYAVGVNNVLVHNTGDCFGLLEDGGTDGAHHLDDLIDNLTDELDDFQANQLAPNEIVQNHHLITNPMADALDEFGFDGQAMRNLDDLQYPSAPGGHYGYEDWHIAYNQAGVDFISEQGTNLSEESLYGWMHNYYQQPSIAARIPGVDLSHLFP
jgi:hypothetical protein